MSGVTQILLVGCGKMGSAMLAGWRSQGIAAEEVVVVEPAEELARHIVERHAVTVVSGAADIPEGFSPAIVIFAVKPQMMDAAVPDYTGFIKNGAMALSIAAGKTLGYFERHFGAGCAVVRTMPNTPAAVGRGITALYANAHATSEQKAAAEALLQAVGETVWLEEEGQMDAVTALSGGGPAYVFLLIETMTKAGVAAGLPEDVAAKLAHATVCGAGELARLADEPPEQLRKNVTSPGGTTLEALNVLMAEEGIQPLFDRAIAAATRRSRELAG
jgi:pyrroline-5-carboxylate reductase